MSEYQCYEFVALERPLTNKQMAELRAVSTRAEITPRRFWNEYHWGDFKGDAAKLVARYFDAHLYFANWGTRRLMLRLPSEKIAIKSLRPYFVGGAARASRTGQHVIVDLRSDQEGSDYYEDEADEVSLTALTPLRTELMRGDFRVAYLAWLLAVEAGDVAEDATEPPVVPGLSNLTAAQQAMVEFSRLDRDLLTAAAVASPARRFRLQTKTPAGGPRRSVAELFSIAEEVREKRRTSFGVHSGASARRASERQKR